MVSLELLDVAAESHGGMGGRGEHCFPEFVLLPQGGDQVTSKFIV